LLNIGFIIAIWKQPKKPSQIFAKSRTNKNAQYSIEVQVRTALQEIVNHLEGENKRYAQFIKINKVTEIPNGKEKATALVYFSHKTHKVLLTPLYKKNSERA